MKTREDYEAYGKRAARTNATEHPYPRTSKSWQARAYWRGFNEGKSGVTITQTGPDSRRMTSSMPTLAQVPKAPVRSPYWRDDISSYRQVDVPLLYSLGNAMVAPIATREHLKLLGAAHNEEHDLVRRARLYLSIRRVLHRWGRRYRPNPHEPAVPMKRPAAAA